MTLWGGQHGTTQVAIVFVFLVLAFIILSLRLFTRVIVTRNHGPEDWVIAAAFVGLLGIMIRRLSISNTCIVLFCRAGSVCTGHVLHKADLIKLTYLEALYKAIPIYLAGLTLTKLSILLQYMRIFKDKTIQRVIIGMMVFVVAYGTWSVVGSLLLCVPVHYFWDGLSTAHCMNFKAKWFSDATINIITDLILLSMPMPFLRGLNLPYRSKAGLIGVFALGGLLGPLYIIATNSDVSKYNGPAALLSSMEVNVGIICASLPSLRAITLRTCSRRNSNRHPAPSSRHSHSGWWRFGKRNDNVELEAGSNQDLSNEGSAITKMVSIKMDTQERRDSKKLSIWSINGGGGGGIFDGGAAKAYIRSDIQ
ncbi:hypothetical protein E4T48_03322 [Aureobasidium sp. EXF-10727]|nr:hypothetical protein E4T48_03322 [Aureobasidium sp. EXF-10727]